MLLNLPRTFHGAIPDDIDKNIHSLVAQFEKTVEHIIISKCLRIGMVRSMLVCNTIIVVDQQSLWIAACKMIGGNPETVYVKQTDKSLTVEKIHEYALLDLGYDSVFVLQFPIALLDMDSEQRENILEAIAAAHVSSEIHHFQRQMNIIQITPFFGPASYAVDPRLAFVLMPFESRLDNIYKSIIKPVVEEPCFGLVCRRADEVRSNKAIMLDVWKSICEARIVIADLTNHNPNVFYELGIAHTVGKEVVLIHQETTGNKFPFDLSHIRRIEYEDTALGGSYLATELRATLKSILFP